jgi:uncharacterized protein YcbX
MIIGRIGALWRYPVKSMRGEAIESSSVTERGLPGDRAYALIDRATGKVASAKHPRLWGCLLGCQACLTASPGGLAVPPIRITLPDGRVVTTAQDDLNAVLSELCEREVTISAAVPTQAEIERYWPDIEGMALRETITSGTIGSGAPGRTFFDFAPLHMLTTATLARLQALYPAGRFDARRFRPNLVIAPNDGTPGFVENSWVGQTILVGDEVRLRITDPSPRCVVPTLPQADLPRDLGILRTVVANNRPPIPTLGGTTMPSAGVYAVIEKGGTVKVGDAIQLASA